MTYPQQPQQGPPPPWDPPPAPPQDSPPPKKWGLLKKIGVGVAATFGGIVLLGLIAGPAEDDPPAASVEAAEEEPEEDRPDPEPEPEPEEDVEPEPEPEPEPEVEEVAEEPDPEPEPEPDPEPATIEVPVAAGSDAIRYLVLLDDAGHTGERRFTVDAGEEMTEREAKAAYMLLDLTVLEAGPTTVVPGDPVPADATILIRTRDDS